MKTLALLPLLLLSSCLFTEKSFETMVQRVPLITLPWGTEQVTEHWNYGKYPELLINEEKLVFIAGLRKYFSIPDSSFRSYA